MDLLQAAVRLEDLHDLVGVFLAVRRQQVAHHLLDQRAAGPAQVAAGDAGLGRSSGLRNWTDGGLLAGAAADDGLLRCFPSSASKT